MSKEVKTKATKIKFSEFLLTVAEEDRKKEIRILDKIMREATGKRPVVWGTAIVGYDRYESSSGQWPIVAFSPRKSSLVVYIMDGFKNKSRLLTLLGKHKLGKSCLYLNGLEDKNIDALRKIVEVSVKAMRNKHQDRR
jgi:hypothetical protein